MDIEPQNHWQRVDKAYIPYLRVHTGILFFLMIIALWGSAYLFEIKEHFLSMGFALVFLIVLATVLIVLWAPARYRRSRYKMDEPAIHFESGYIFWRSAAIPLNRIQHVEVQQGPIERHFSLGHLKIYTAGSLGSDLTVPGLLIGDAHTLKDQLLLKHEALDKQDSDIHD